LDLFDIYYFRHFELIYKGNQNKNRYDTTQNNENIKIEWQNNFCHLNEQIYKYILIVIKMDRIFVGD